MGVYCTALGDGTAKWHIQYTVNGRRVTEVVPATTRREAIECLGKRKAEVLEGRFFNLPKAAKTSFREWAEEYLEIKQNQGVRSMRRVNLSVRGLVDYFGDHKLNQIRPSDVEAFKSWMLRKKSLKRPEKSLSGATVNRYLAQLKNLFSVARREGLLDSNPVSSVKFEKEHGKRNRVLSDDEFELLLSYCSEPLYGLVLTAWETGMRKSEITSLTWDCIDMKNDLITLKPERTKTNEARTIPISFILKDYLTSLPRSLRKPNVFLYRGKSMNDFKNSWDTARTNAKIENFWFHDLRRCFITRMRRLGVDFFTVRAITGHKTMAAFGAYQAIELKDIKDAVERLSTAAKLQRESEKIAQATPAPKNSSIKTDT